jgi:hypothetical protein
MAAMGGNQLVHVLACHDVARQIGGEKLAKV